MHTHTPHATLAEDVCNFSARHNDVAVLVAVDDLRKRPKLVAEPLQLLTELVRKLLLNRRSRRSGSGRSLLVPTFNLIFSLFEPPLQFTHSDELRGSFFGPSGARKTTPVQKRSDIVWVAERTTFRDIEVQPDLAARKVSALASLVAGSARCVSIW